MSVLNPQSIVSSRLHTNNNLKDINDSRKIGISERNKIMMAFKYAGSEIFLVIIKYIKFKLSIKFQLLDL